MYCLNQVVKIIRLERSFVVKSCRFIVMADTHFFAPGNGVDSTWWNRALGSQCERVAASIVETITEFKPDFVINCGDFTGHCNIDNYNYGVEIMNELGCPWYMTVGNHDCELPDVRRAVSSRLGLPKERCYYSELINGILFVFLDSCYWRNSDGLVSAYPDKNDGEAGKIADMDISFCREEIQWLDNQLRHNADKSVILVSHAPIAHKEVYEISTLPGGKPTAEHLLKPAEYGIEVAMREEVIKVINGHRNVKLAFAGHWHINDVTKIQDTVYCQTASLREYPFEFRLVESDGASLAISTHGLKDGGLNEESFVKEWGNYWVRGAESDRQCVVKL